MKTNYIRSTFGFNALIIMSLFSTYYGNPIQASIFLTGAMLFDAIKEGNDLVTPPHKED